MLFFDRFKPLAKRKQQSKNSLEIDLGMGQGEILIYRFTSWDEGLKCTIEDSEGIRDRGFEEDLPIKFSHLAYLQQSQDWLSSFPSGLPDKIISFQYSYPGKLYPVLLLLADTRHNLEFFMDLPVLFWAVFHRAQQANYSQQQITELFSRPRVELLEFCGLPGNRPTLNGLRKLSFERMSKPLWELFAQFAVLASERKELHHLSVITEGALQFVNRYPDLTRARSLALSDQHTKWEDILETTAEIHRMTEVLGIEIDKPRFTRARDNVGLSRYHDALSERILEQSFADEVLSFPKPLLPGNDAIQPILDSYELALEGKSMHHCVYSYSQDIIDGSCSVYRVIEPERATLKVSIDKEGMPRIAELKLKSNKPADKSTVLQVNRWLKNQYQLKSGL